MTKILSGKECSLFYKEQLKKEIEKIEKKLKLVVVRIGNDEASKIYVNSKKKACLEIGIDCEEIHFDETVTNDIVIDKINELNNNQDVTSILVQLPIPKRLDVNKIINTIDYKKDVDGLTTTNIGKLNNNEKGIVPATPNGIMKMLEYYNIDLEGKHVVVVGRSNLVGKPLISLLLNKNATVTVCHSKTNSLHNFTRNADILISAVGKKGLITCDMVKDDVIIIDVGINRVDGKLIGDVDTENVAEKAKYITPVPGGVGLTTVYTLMENVIELAEQNK